MHRINNSTHGCNQPWAGKHISRRTPDSVALSVWKVSFLLVLLCASYNIATLQQCRVSQRSLTARSRCVMQPSHYFEHALIFQQPMGHINPDVPPLTEKRNVFNPNVDARSVTSSEKDAGKKEPYVGEMEETDLSDQQITVDPFVPYDDLPDERKRVLTVRAMIVGCICGALVNASNIYLGLKTGWVSKDYAPTAKVAQLTFGFRPSVHPCSVQSSVSRY